MHRDECIYSNFINTGKVESVSHRTNIFDDHHFQNHNHNHAQICIYKYIYLEFQKILQ